MSKAVAALLQRWVATTLIYSVYSMFISIRYSITNVERAGGIYIVAGLYTSFGMG